jgi:hypothetical protein
MIRVRGTMIRMTQMMSAIMEIGLSIKIEKLPCDIKSERLRLTSNIGPSTNPRTIGAAS